MGKLFLTVSENADLITLLISLLAPFYDFIALLLVSSDPIFGFDETVSNCDSIFATIINF
jgi:hypothetical protein